MLPIIGLPSIPKRSTLTVTVAPYLLHAPAADFHVRHLSQGLYAFRIPHGVQHCRSNTVKERPFSEQQNTLVLASKQFLDTYCCDSEACFKGANVFQADRNTDAFIGAIRSFILDGV